MTVETVLFFAGALLAVVLLGPLAVAVPMVFQLALLISAVVVLGLPHGALDPWIARQAGVYRGNKGLLVFNLAYLGLAGLVVLAWWASPVLALVLFLLLSGWHFADDWHESLKPWQRLIAALALLSMPAVFHPISVEMIFVALSGAEAVVVVQGLRALGYVAVAGLLLVMVVALFQRRHAALVELGVLLVLAAAVPPLLYFTLYFCLLHSPRHLRASYVHAAPGERTGLLATALIYTLFSVLIGALVAAFLLPRADLEQLALQLVFIGLAALTVPHMVLMMMKKYRRASPRSAC